MLKGKQKNLPPALKKKIMAAKMKKKKTKMKKMLCEARCSFFENMFENIVERWKIRDSSVYQDMIAALPVTLSRRIL